MAPRRSCAAARELLLTDDPRHRAGTIRDDRKPCVMGLGGGVRSGGGLGRGSRERRLAWFARGARAADVVRRLPRMRARDERRHGGVRMYGNDHQVAVRRHGDVLPTVAARDADPDDVELVAPADPERELRP
jgi:hypothetical protein